MTKNSPAKATDAHISIIGHITDGELHRYLSVTETSNGFANRFLLCCVRRSKYLPLGGSLTDEELRPIVIELGKAIEFASSIGEKRFDDDAEEHWCRIYRPLADGDAGSLGAVTARGLTIGKCCTSSSQGFSRTLGSNRSRSDNRRHVCVSTRFQSVSRTLAKPRE
jgi:hypothetical protein